VKNIKIIIFVYVLFCGFYQLKLIAQDQVELTGSFFNQKNPGFIPEIFLPGIISTEDHEHGITINPCGNEIYFTRRISREEGNRIYFTKKVDGVWIKPILAPFAKLCRESSPNISPDGKRLFFNSRRSLPEEIKSPYEMNVWFVSREGEKWVNPEVIKNPVMEYYPMFVTQTNKGVIYFTGNVNRGIYKADLENGRYVNVEKLPEEINSHNWAGHPYVDPEEKYIIFDSNIDEAGTKNLFISFKEKNYWTESVNINQCEGFPKHAAIAHVSFDKRYLFFSVKPPRYVNNIL